MCNHHVAPDAPGSRTSPQDDSTLVSVFFFDANAPNRRNLLPLAKNALRKLRTTRHPDVLKFIDVVETDTTIYIVTERVYPLGAALDAWKGKPAAAIEEWLIWGLHRIAVRIHCPLSWEGHLINERPRRLGWHLSMTRVSQRMATFESIPSSSPHLANGSWAGSSCFQIPKTKQRFYMCVVSDTSDSKHYSPRMWVRPLAL